MVADTTLQMEDPLLLPKTLFPCGISEGITIGDGPWKHRPVRLLQLRLALCAVILGFRMLRCLCLWLFIRVMRQLFGTEPL